MGSLGIKNSILLDTKKCLGISEDYEAFDQDLIIHINSILATLAQLGVGDPEGFAITGPEETWTDWLGEGMTKLNMVKSYVYGRTRIIFDPPTSSFALDALKKTCDEFEWRLNVEADSWWKQSTVEEFLEE